MSAAGIPQIAVVMGSCTAGGAYVPAMSDEAIIVEGQGTIFLAGPPLVRGGDRWKSCPSEDLGGGDVHTRLSGVCRITWRADDAHALALARRAVAKPQTGFSIPTIERQAPEEPAYDPDDIAGVVPLDLRTPYDISRGDRPDR